jgi:hypothetical protein
MAQRIFSEAERDAMTRKPESLEDVAELALTRERYEALCQTGALLLFSGDLSGLGAAIREAQIGTEFLAQDEETGLVYAVNTEGYDYARYVAVLS